MTLRRKKPLRRSSAPLPRTPVKRKRRKPSEFARVYGSKARVAWVKETPCIWCGTTPSENAHTRIDGMGRKAGYETIAPMCWQHHRDYDQCRPPFDKTSVREMAKFTASLTEAAWQQHLARSA